MRKIVHIETDRKSTQVIVDSGKGLVNEIKKCKVKLADSDMLQIKSWITNAVKGEKVIIANCTLTVV